MGESCHVILLLCCRELHDDCLVSSRIMWSLIMSSRIMLYRIIAHSSVLPLMTRAMSDESIVSSNAHSANAATTKWLLHAAWSWYCHMTPMMQMQANVVFVWNESNKIKASSGPFRIITIGTVYFIVRVLLPGMIFTSLLTCLLQNKTKQIWPTRSSESIYPPTKMNHGTADDVRANNSDSCHRKAHSGASEESSPW
jgi:hypothetical protein